MLSIAEILDALQNPAAYDIDYRNGELFIAPRAAADQTVAPASEPARPRAAGPCPTRRLLQRQAVVRIAANAA